ncbi:MAG: hypothetical protein CVV14_03655 [Gammaproteobacteria bacterium HGW-Gammaproteobacteria-4]|nr:MAG: hypothetical protein CVV14_03655 [Gammaproteobacteria bacterium HGW-Gammaproteobacteria-4]
MAFDAVASALAHALAGVGRQRRSRMQGTAQPLAIAGLEQPAVDVIAHDILAAADAAGEHRQAGRHAFEQGVGQTLDMRGQHTEIRVNQQRFHILAMAGERHLRGDAVCLNPVCQRFE